MMSLIVAAARWERYAYDEVTLALDIMLVPVFKNT